MKFRVRIAEMGRVGAVASMPENARLMAVAMAQEDPQFVAVGATPGRRVPVVRLSIEGLVPGAVPFELNDEVVLTLERVLRQ